MRSCFFARSLHNCGRGLAMQTPALRQSMGKRCALPDEGRSRKGLGSAGQCVILHCNMKPFPVVTQTQARSFVDGGSQQADLAAGEEDAGLASWVLGRQL
ncbi:unnamed protein product [Symbiodinium sp. CCMP2456]|nr:unnamed protein product [Symbiodinium sp. CCMP2456]